jgi:hypothetical protein
MKNADLTIAVSFKSKTKFFELFKLQFSFKVGSVLTTPLAKFFVESIKKVSKYAEFYPDLKSVQKVWKKCFT